MNYYINSRVVDKNIIISCTNNLNEKDNKTFYRKRRVPKKKTKKYPTKPKNFINYEIKIKREEIMKYI